MREYESGAAVLSRSRPRCVAKSRLPSDADSQRLVCIRTQVYPGTQQNRLLKLASQGGIRKRMPRIKVHRQTLRDACGGHAPADLEAEPWPYVQGGVSQSRSQARDTQRNIHLAAAGPAPQKWHSCKHLHFSNRPWTMHEYAGKCFTE